MSDAAWTTLGFAALALNLFALLGHEALRRPGQFSLGAVPHLLLVSLCLLWWLHDDRPAVRAGLGAYALAALCAGVWTRRRLRRRVVESTSPRGSGGEGAVGPKVLVYTMAQCPFCLRAKELLRSKGVTFEEVDLDLEPGRWEECERRSGRETVPQIFVGDRHLGGCDDLLNLEAAGELDGMLRG